MPIVIHWDWEGHSVLKPLQSSCNRDIVITSNCASRSCPCCSNFQRFIFEYGASIQNLRNFAPLENFPLYGTASEQPRMSWLVSSKTMVAKVPGYKSPFPFKLSHLEQWPSPRLQMSLHIKGIESRWLQLENWFLWVLTITVVSRKSTHSQKVPTPYIWPNLLYRVKVYSNEHPPWSELLIVFEKYSFKCYAYVR